MDSTLLTATVLRLADGRDLAFCEYGDRNGLPVFAFHGTPGSRLQVSPPPSAPLPAGYRLIAPDRPGYGHSTYDASRKLTDWPNDVCAIADHLGIERFGVMGISGGGPHALVCAHAIAPRLRGVACVSGIGPLYDPAALDGMMRLNRWLARLSRNGGPLMRKLMQLQLGAMRRNPARALDAMASQLPPYDQAIVAEPEFRAMMLEDLQRSSATAALAATQDFQLFASDWGFRFQDISVPVHFFQGDVDRNVPVQHALLMANKVPGAILHRYPGEGHFMVFKRLDEVLQTTFGDA